jgi:hypothetical protein
MPDTEIKDAIDQVRSATQQLHKAISDAAAKRGGAVTADLQAVPQMAKAAVDSIRGSMAAQNEAARKRLAEAVTYLEATGKHAADGVRSSGKEFQTAVRQTIAGRAGGRAKGQRSGGGHPHGGIHSEREKVGEDHAQLHRCGV